MTKTGWEAGIGTTDSYRQFHTIKCTLEIGKNSAARPVKPHPALYPVLLLVLFVSRCASFNKCRVKSAIGFVIAFALPS